MNLNEMKEAYVAEMVDGYVECALWSSVNPDYLEDESQPEMLDEFDSSDEFEAEARRDCEDFLAANLDDLTGHMTAAQAGHDFWLSRNGHGAGYFDRGLGEVGERLTKAAKVYGGVDLWHDPEMGVRAM